MNFIIMQFLTVRGNSPRASLPVLRLSVKKDDVRTDVITAFFFVLQSDWSCNIFAAGTGQV